jgi:hypothetical protein
MTIAGFHFKHQRLRDADYELLYRSKSINDIGLVSDRINVFDTSENREEPGHYTRLVELLEQHSWPYIVLTSEPAQSREKLCYYPFCLRLVEKLSKFNTDITSPRPYKFCSLNGNAHAHRIWLYFNLLKNLDSCLYTWHNQPGDPAELAELDPGLLAECQKLPTTKPTTTHFNNQHPAYSSAYVDICAETMMRNETFISEKTWKPIASGQFFLIAGGVGTIEYLRSQGVDVFDDIIDHSYDAPGTWQERVAKFAVSVKKLAQQDLDQLWKDTVERRRANIELIASRSISNHYVHKINQQVKLYYPDF